MRRWVKHEVKILKEKYPVRNVTLESLSKKLNRTVPAIQRKAFRLNIKGTEYKRKRDEKTREKISKGLRKYAKNRTPEHKANLYAALRGRKMGEEARRNMSRARKGKKQTKKHAMKKGKSVSRYIEANPEKFFGRFKQRPTKPEKELDLILDKLGLGFDYVGNYRFFIGRCNPDFINYEKRLVVEMFGVYWHKKEDIQKRTEYFKKFGWNTLVVWEDELSQGELLEEKLTVFAGR